MLKRMIIGLVVLAVALGSLGLMTAGAQDDTTAKAYLGVRIADSDDGVTVTAVEPGSPADEAGLRIGDVIEAVDDTAIESAEQLVEVIGGYAPGDTITLTISWRGDSREVTVTLAERPAAQPSPVPGLRDRARDRLHQNMPAVRGMLNLLGLELQISDEGIVVENIAEDSPLADSGLQEGDVITAINGEVVTDLGPWEIMKALRGTAEDQTLTLTVQRDGEEVTVEIDLSTLDLGPMPFGMGELDLGTLPGMVGRAYLGVSYQTINAALAESEDLPVDQGALVRDVAEDSPAATAELQVGDIITAINGEAVDEAHTLAERLYAYDPGDTVTLDVLRAGETLSIEVELGSRAGLRLGNLGSMMGNGRMGRDMMEWFFKNHPHLGEMFQMAPDGSMRFRFGPDWPDMFAPDAPAPETTTEPATGSAA